MLNSMPSPPGLPLSEMEFRRMLFPVAVSPMTITPWLALPEMVLAASGTVPPIVLPEASETNTPWKFPRLLAEISPPTSVPIKFP